MINTKRPNIPHYTVILFNPSSTKSNFTFTVAFQNTLKSWPIVISTKMQLLVNIFHQEARLLSDVYLTLKVSQLVMKVLQSIIFQKGDLP